jgi:uncharacterized protein HemX
MDGLFRVHFLSGQTAAYTLLIVLIVLLVGLVLYGMIQFINQQKHTDSQQIMQIMNELQTNYNKERSSSFLMRNKDQKESNSN